VQLRTSYVKSFESCRLTDRQTDTTEIIYDAACGSTKVMFHSSMEDNVYDAATDTQRRIN